MSPRILPLGDRALLLELPDLPAVPAWHGDLLADPEPGQQEALAAARTVLLRFADPAAAARARRALPRRRPAPAALRPGREVRIETVYDGQDLAEVARASGLTPEQVIAAHTGTPWRGAFGGFAPGFLYLSGGDARLAVPRRCSPRTRVPAGAVALAGEHSAVYPRVSPGGWQLIGRTDAPLWDADREPPALLAPGDTVRFVAVRERVRASGMALAPPTGRDAIRATAPPTGRDATPSPAPPSTAASGAPERPALRVLAAGIRTLIEDLGRPGRGDLGVTASGAADAPSARQANRLVGNPPGAAVLETLLGGLRIEALTPVVLALTGAIGEARVVTELEAEDSEGGMDEGTPVLAPVGAPFALDHGQQLELGHPASGLRGYLAVRGGIQVVPVLGSRSTDTLAGLGPAPLASGDVLVLGAAHGPGLGISVGLPEPPATACPAPGEVLTLRVAPGPRADRISGDAGVGVGAGVGIGGGVVAGAGVAAGARADAPAAGPDDDLPPGLRALLARRWSAGPDSDRIGVRLLTEDGPLSRVREDELPSEGLVPGAIQVPPSGLPVVFLADHPVTGGYPVIGVVLPQDLPRLAQAPPGTAIRFTSAVRRPVPAGRATTRDRRSSR